MAPESRELQAASAAIHSDRSRASRILSAVFLHRTGCDSGCKAGVVLRSQRDPKCAQVNLGDANWAVGISHHMQERWERLFQKWLGDAPAAVNAPCCAEFMVKRERVLARPLEFYQNALDALKTGNPGNPPDQRIDSFQIGFCFEQLWHHIFGEPYLIHAISKCELFECTEEEKADTNLVPPPVPDPYRLVQLDQVEAAAATAAGAEIDALAGGTQNKPDATAADIAAAEVRGDAGAADTAAADTAGLEADTSGAAQTQL